MLVACAHLLAGARAEAGAADLFFVDGLALDRGRRAALEDLVRRKGRLLALLPIERGHELLGFERAPFVGHRSAQPGRTRMDARTSTVCPVLVSPRSPAAASARRSAAERGEPSATSSGSEPATRNRARSAHRSA